MDLPGFALPLVETMDDQDFIAALVGKPEDAAPLLIYADWLEEHGDARAEYLRLQVEYRRLQSQPRSFFTWLGDMLRGRSKQVPADMRKRLIETYPADHLAWTATLEQAGAIEANLTRFEFSWWGTAMGPVGEAAYEQYHHQPPLPVESFDGTFAWLRQSEPSSSYSSGSQWKAFCEEKRRQGFFVPAVFEAFLSTDDMPSRIKSCNNNCFDEPEYCSGKYEDGLIVIFYADSQGCVVWSILLPREPGRYAPILAGPPDSFFPYGDPEYAEDEDEKPISEPVFVASQLEPFLYRLWIENEIWYATEGAGTQRPLTPVEKAYASSSGRTYSQQF